MDQKNDWKRYLIVFFITATLFGSGLWLSNFFNNKKLNQLQGIQEKISLDLMSSETQFDLLQELSCKDISTTVLSSELNSLAEKISYSENNFKNNNESVVSLKKMYSLLEIKDYLLMKKITQRCGQKSVFVLYFYGNSECKDCTKQSYVLTELRGNYPNLRVYSFDYNLDSPAIRSMISIYKVPEKLPAIVINGKVYDGFQSLEDIEKYIPEIAIWKKEALEAEALEKAEKEKAKTSTKKTTTEETPTTTEDKTN